MTDAPEGPAGTAAGDRRTPDLPAFYRLVALDVCGSTNDEAKRLAQAGAPEGTLVWARRQRGGRGRRGRAWTSSDGNLFMTVVLRPRVPPAQAAQISFVAAVALAEAVAGLIPGAPKLKWPNDVLIDGAKVAGILLESEPGLAGAIDWVVLGVGVNVAQFPPGLDYAATSIAASGSPHIGVEAVLERFAAAFAAWYARWQSQGFAPIRAAWLNIAAGLGGPVTVRLSGESFAARFADLDEEGALVAETDGALRRVTAGDVFFA